MKLNFYPFRKAVRKYGKYSPCHTRDVLMEAYLSTTGALVQIIPKKLEQRVLHILFLT